MNMYFQNQNNMTTSPAKRLWDNLCIKFTKVWFNLTPNNKSQKQTVHINIIFCEFRLLHRLFVLHPQNCCYGHLFHIIHELSLQYKTPKFVIRFSLWVVLHAMELICISFYHICFSKTISNCFLTLSVHVIAKITVVFQCVNELHVNVWNDINHSWTLWLFYLTCNIFFILSDHHTLHTFYNLI